MTSRSDILMEIRAIAARELEFSGPIEESHGLQSDLHLDSVSMVVVAVGLENKFRIKLDEHDAPQLKTIGDLISLVERRLSVPPGAALP